MTHTFIRRLYVSIPLWIIPLLLCPGCQFRKAPVPIETPQVPRIETMVVVGFQAAVSEWEESDVVRSPLSGAVFMGGPVSQDVVKGMNAKLFDRMLADKQYELISPNQAKGVYSSLVSSDTAMGEIEIIKKIGRAFSADAVLIGYLYRWREREGTDFAVTRPASVAFDLYLVRPKDGAILWKGRFDKTQRSLSENVLDMNFFLKGKGRWMTADKMAELGLGSLLGQLLERVGDKRTEP